MSDIGWGNLADESVLNKAGKKLTVLSKFNDQYRIGYISDE